MNEIQSQNRFEVLRPLLDTQGKKDLDAQQKILDLFPNETWPAIAKAVQAFCEKEQNSTRALVQRLSRAVGGDSAETTTQLVTSLKKLSVADLKKVGKELGLAVAGKKTEIVSDLQTWLESGGTEKPKTPEEKVQEFVQPYLNRALPLMENVDTEKAGRLLQIIDEAYKDKNLGKPGLEVLANGLRITVNGTKAKIKSQLKDFINRLAVMHVQTHV